MNETTCYYTYSICGAPAPEMEKPGNHDGKQKGSSADERAAGSRFFFGKKKAQWF